MIITLKQRHHASRLFSMQYAVVSIHQLCVLQANLDVETLLKQFQIVKRETNTSHVMQYGDMVRTGDIYVQAYSISLTWMYHVCTPFRHLQLHCGTTSWRNVRNQNIKIHKNKIMQYGCNKVVQRVDSVICWINNYPVDKLMLLSNKFRFIRYQVLHLTSSTTQRRRCGFLPGATCTIDMEIRGLSQI